MMGTRGWGKGQGGFWRRWSATPAAQPAQPDDGSEALRAGRYADAERLLVASLGRAERHGAGSPELAGVLAKLADLYRIRARYDEAESLYLRAIALDRGRATDDAALARALNNLALIYRAQGYYDRAEPLCLQALALAEQTHGGENALTAAAVDNLLAVYLAQCRYGDAEPLFRRALAMKERLLGPSHPSLAGSLSNYAAFLRKTRGDAAAAECEARARAIRGETQG
jgi:tetratricopeptide (TPR) repeat protein